MYYLIKKQYSLEEIEWIMAQKFPVEAEDFPDMKRGRYYELTTDPILRRFKMSGPSTASILIDNILIGITDRDHMRQFTVAWNDNVVIFASEEMAVLSSAYLMQEDVEIINPMPGQIIGFMLKDDKLERLSHTWRLEKKEKI
jgi:glutamate synthase domain-containing protein 1